MEKETECEIVQDLLLGYVDEILNEESKKLVEKHLSECENCRERLKEIREDIKKNQNNSKKEIDYLKKIRKNNRIKAVFMAIGFIFLIFFTLFVVKFIKINNIMNNAKETLQSNNIYIEISQILADNRTSVIRKYYKDGKYKETRDMYSEDDVENLMTIYITLGSNEIYNINEVNKTVSLEKGKYAKVMNNKDSLIADPFVQNNIFTLLKKTYMMSIYEDTNEFGRNYYVFKDKFQKSQNWEIWIDKEWGLPLKEINRNSVTLNYLETDIIKEVRDNVKVCKYEFGKVTDEDVQMPDLSEYEIKEEFSE